MRGGGFDGGKRVEREWLLGGGYRLDQWFGGRREGKATGRKKGGEYQN